MSSGAQIFTPQFQLSKISYLESIEGTPRFLQFLPVARPGNCRSLRRFKVFRDPLGNSIGQS